MGCFASPSASCNNIKFLFFWMSRFLTQSFTAHCFSVTDSPSPLLGGQRSFYFVSGHWKVKGSNIMKGLPAGRATLLSVWTHLQLQYNSFSSLLHHFTPAQWGLRTALTWYNIGKPKTEQPVLVVSNNTSLDGALWSKRCQFHLNYTT